MRALKRIDRAVTHRCCPGCGLLTAQLQVDLFRFNFDCPRCGKHPISEFQPLKLSTHQTTGDTE